MKAYLNATEMAAQLPRQALLETGEMPYPLVASGKVRDIFDTGDAYLMVASDRLSAFDVVLPDGIPGKGILLTQMSLYWFGETAPLLPNHLVDDHAAQLRAVVGSRTDLLHRSMLVKKLQPLKIEAVVRQYLAGGGWKHYLNTGTLFGIPVPAGLQESAQLPIPLFTPTTKAPLGEHDLPLSPEEGARLLGAARFAEVQDISLRLFALGSAVARSAGLLLADTKFEFGTDADGQLHLIDEVLTPDSSRYWPKADYAPGQPQTAFDKQFVRDYLESTSWDKTAPGPRLPAEVIQQTQQRYLQAARLLMPKAQ
jgi:phosphoribosylaminoimidazole-succinocarboxamide synthase